MEILFFTYPLATVLIFVVALGIGIYLTRRFQLPWRLYFIGGAVFILSQVFHLPFNAYVLPALSRAGILPSDLGAWTLPFWAVIYGLSAGIFEEGGRYLMYRFWTKSARWWGQGLLLGAGHGGMEAIIVALLGLNVYIQMVVLRGMDIAAVVPPERLASVEQLFQTYWNSPWYDSFLSFIERLFTIPVHIALSVIVLQVYTRKQIRWLFLAIIWHTLLNAVGAVYVANTYGIYAAEAVIGLFSVLSIGIILVLRQPAPAPNPEEALPPSPGVRAFVPPAVEETEEKLDSTRFSH